MRYPAPSKDTYKTTHYGSTQPNQPDAQCSLRTFLYTRIKPIIRSCGTDFPNRILYCNSYPFGYFQTWSMVKKLTFSLPFAFPFINGFCSESGGYHHSFSKNLFCRAHSLDPTPSRGVQKSSISITTDHVSWEIPALEHAKCWKSRVQSWQKNKKLAADLASWFLGGEVVWERSWFMEDVRLAEGYLGSKWTHPFKKKISLD